MERSFSAILFFIIVIFINFLCESSDKIDFTQQEEWKGIDSKNPESVLEIYSLENPWKTRIIDNRAPLKDGQYKEYPNRAILALEADFEKGIRRGTAFMIHQHFALTNYHNLFKVGYKAGDFKSSMKDCEPLKVKCTAGKEENNFFYSETCVSAFVIPTDAQIANQYDYALLYFEKPLGEHTGFFACSGEDDVKNKTFSLPGYPMIYHKDNKAINPKGTKQLTDSSNSLEIGEDFITHPIFCSSGQSGSPLLIEHENGFFRFLGMQTNGCDGKRVEGDERPLENKAITINKKVLKNLNLFADFILSKSSTYYQSSGRQVVYDSREEGEPLKKGYFYSLRDFLIPDKLLDSYNKGISAFKNKNYLQAMKLLKNFEKEMKKHRNFSPENNGDKIQKKYAKALRIIGLILIDEDAKTQTYIKGVDYLKTSAKLGNEDALIKFLKISEIDSSNFDLFEKAEKNGNLFVTYKLSQYYRKSDTESYISKLKSASNKNYIPACYDLAQCYFNGEGVKKSFPTCINFLKKIHQKCSSSKNAKEKYLSSYKKACYEIGLHKHKGLRDPDNVRNRINPNLKEAHKFLKISAELGHMKAQYLLGQCHETGCDGLNSDPQKVQEYYKKAASQGHMEAKEKLGIFSWTKLYFNWGFNKFFPKLNSK